MFEGKVKSVGYLPADFFVFLQKNKQKIAIFFKKTFQILHKYSIIIFDEGE